MGDGIKREYLGSTRGLGDEAAYTLGRLQAWYAAHCNGDWEHQNGVSIGTLDNPGWSVKVELTGTALDGQEYSEVPEGVGAGAHPESNRWIHCIVRDGQWQGFADESQLDRLLRMFLDRADRTH